MVRARLAEIIRCGISLLILLSSPIPAAAVDQLQLLALFENKALLNVDGQRRLMHAGETSPEGLLLVSANTDQAVVEVSGRREVLRLGFAATIPGSEAKSDPTWKGLASISLWADPSGFFYVPGLINGYPVRFLVDTGATTVALSSEMAERIGIDYTKGQKGIARTASGVTPMYGLDLKSVAVGGIKLNNVSAGVIIGAYPTVPLLGMSFLGQLDMVREGNRLDLKRRN